MRREYNPSGSGGGISIEPSWQFYKQLEFLAPFVKQWPTLCNLSQNVDNTDPEATTSETCQSNGNADMETIFAAFDDSQVMAAAVHPPVPAEADLSVMDGEECTNNSIESRQADNSFQAGPIPKRQLKRPKR